ncbi:MAG: MotA/TolQ/ExbB proton channel family protein [Leptospiraceae bacterium]|nr:MotA/TolQ/ExbB proton channel family protein [Leptospiraceae bacterium]
MGMIQIVDLGEEAIFILMGIASVIAVAVFIERLMVFNRNVRKSETILEKITELLREGKISDLIEYGKDFPKNVYSRFAAFSAGQYNRGDAALTELMEGKIIEEKIQLEKRLPILSTLGNNAPFLGLLGTVLGVIKAFNNLGTLGNSGAEVVMKSISTALLATAAGLFVAIPVVMANNYFNKKAKVISQNLEILAREFLASLKSNKV